MQPAHPLTALAVALSLLNPPVSTARVVLETREATPSTSITPIPAPVVTQSDLDLLIGRELSLPVPGTRLDDVHDSFAQLRGTTAHKAIDFVAPRGAPVVAVDDGVVQKLFTSVAGGLAVYLFDREQRFVYYYAHLDAYAESLREGQLVWRGDVIGYVGTTGNAASDNPHLHFAIFKLGPEKRWWEGTPIDPYPVVIRRPGARTDVAE